MDLDKIGFIKNYSEMFKSIILSYGQWGCILHILILMDHKQGYGKNNRIRRIVVFFIWNILQLEDDWKMKVFDNVTSIVRDDMEKNNR